MHFTVYIFNNSKFNKEFYFNIINGYIESFVSSSELEPSRYLRIQSCVPASHQYLRQR